MENNTNRVVTFIFWMATVQIVYFGLVVNISFLRNFSLFFLWTEALVMLFISSFAMNDYLLKRQDTVRDSNYLFWYRVAKVSILFLCIYSGYIATSISVVFTLGIHLVMIKKYEETQKEKTNENIEENTEKEIKEWIN